MLGMKPIAPHQTIEIDVKSLRDEQVPDVSGRLIPLELASGQLMWSLKQVGPPPAGEEARQKLALIGRTEQVDVKRGMSSNYACQSCCSNQYHSSFITPSSSEVTSGTQVDFDVFQRDKDCYGEVGLPYPQTLATWSSDVTGVATVNGSGTASTAGAGQTTIRATWSDIRYLQFVMCSNFSPGAPQCLNCDAPTEVTPNPSATLQVKPEITSISPDRGLINSTVGISIIGSGFGSASTVTVGGTGVTASVQSFSSTSLSVTLTISSTATPGNQGVTVTRGGKTSNSVNFFVQVPTSLRRDSISGVNDQQGGCGATRTLLYQLLDQEGAEISSGDTLKETISNFSGPANVRPPDATNIQMVSGTAPDMVGYEIPTCPPAFTATFTQTFTVVVGTQSYTLTSSNAISMGRTGSGAKFVDITFTQ